MAFRRFCEAIVAGAPIEVYGDGHQSRDFTYVADIVAATRAAGETPTDPGRVYNIGGGGPREPQPRAGDAGRARRAARSTCAAASASPATCATRARTRPAPARSSASIRGPTSRSASLRELEWVRERTPGAACPRALSAS